MAIVALCLMCALPMHARAQSADDQYVRIYNLIQEGDSLNNSRGPAPALQKYLEAQVALERFKKVYPDWNVGVVNFRLNYLATRIAAASALAPAAPAPAGPTNKPPASAGQAAQAGELQAQLDMLQRQVGQLQAERMVMEARLKEAFASQPPSVDPHEYARAQEKIQSLQKQNDLLTVTLAQQEAKAAAAGPNTNAQKRLIADLADANRKLAEQTERANLLALQKDSLQSRLQHLAAQPTAPSSLDSARKELAEANRKLAAQTELTSQLTLEREALQARLRKANADAETLAGLRAENEILKKQLARSKSPASSKSKDNPLAQAQAQIAALQSDKQILHLENVALQNRIKQLTAPPIAMSAASPSAPGDSARVTQLERERDALQKKLDAANQELYGAKDKTAMARVDELRNEINLLRAQLEVFTAQKMPYTPAELALFKASDIKLPVLNPNSDKAPIREIPPGTASLVAEAQKDFAKKHYAEAEKKYLEVLRHDEKNPYTLANLAAIQVEQNHFADAEKHIGQALATAPNDSYSLFILGYLRYRQQKYDDALDALSRAAQLNPQDPEIQNYLGITLSQKGQRAAAETALRKAISLDPNYASAQNNLAVFYATQTPPWIPLARWYYQQALAAGQPHDPELEKLLGQKQPAQTGR
jgi:tetratricopeptide (TPR) repeat protein